MLFIVVTSVFAITFLAWILWSLYKAKRFNQFKLQLEKEIKPQVIAKLTEDLRASRSTKTPNNDAHINASIFYWSQYPVRILQAALNYKIIDQQWLHKTGNWRNSQHLFYVEKHYKHTIDNLSKNENHQDVQD